LFQNGPGLAVANYVYTPGLNFSGDDSFAFVANDGKTNSNATTVHLHVIPAVSINNISVLEGNSSASVATFTVTLSPPSTKTVTLNWATLDGTAKAASDYVAGSGTLTFSPGVTQQMVRIIISADTLFEADETFQLRLLSATNAVISTTNGIGTCTILNDDTFIGVTEGIPPAA